MFLHMLRMGGGVAWRMLGKSRSSAPAPYGWWCCLEDVGVTPAPYGWWCYLLEDGWWCYLWGDVGVEGAEMYYGEEVEQTPIHTRPCRRWKDKPSCPHTVLTAKKIFPL